jgi:hypothetical protein
MPGFARSQGSGSGSGGSQGRGLYGAGLRQGTVHSRGWGEPPIISRWGPPRWGHDPWGFGISVSGRRTGHAPRRNEAEALRRE